VSFSIGLRPDSEAHLDFTTQEETMKKRIALFALAFTAPALFGLAAHAQTYDQQRQNQQYPNPYTYNPYQGYGLDQYGRVAPSMPNTDANGNYCNPCAPVGYGGYHC
jgi:hypothetical protein